MRTQIFLNALPQGFLVNFTPFLNFLSFACIPVKSWKAKGSEDSNKNSHQNAEWWCWMTQVECPQQTRVGATSILKVPHCLKFVLEFELYSDLQCMAMVNHYTKHTTFFQDCFQRHSQVEHRDWHLHFSNQSPLSTTYTLELLCWSSNFPQHEKKILMSKAK